MSFPINPTNGQQTTVNGTLYTYNSTLTAWTVTAGGNQAINIAGNIQTASNVLASGIMSATGNIITDEYFVGNFVGNITGNLTVPGSNTQVLFNANGNAGAAAGFTYNSGSNTMTVLGVVSSQGNVIGGNVTTAGIVSASGNVTGSYIFGNGSQLTGIAASSYGDSNVVTLLSNLGSNTVSTTGNVSGGYIFGNGSQLTGIATSSYGDSNVVTLLSNLGANTVSTTGNVTGSYIFGNGSQLTGIATSSYGDANVAAYLPTYNGNILANVITVNILSAGTNIDGANLRTTGVVSALGNITTNVGSFFIGNGSQLTGIVSSYGNSNVTALLSNLGINTVSTTGNVTGGYIFGNGSQLTGIATSSYGDSNVVTLLAGFGSNAISTTGNVSGGNLRTTGSVSATGNVTGSYIFGNGSQLSGLPATYGNSNVVTLLAGFGSNTVSTTGNVSSGNVLSSGIFSAAGNVTGSNLIAANNVVATGNVVATNFVGGGAGTPQLISNTSLILGAATVVQVTGSPFRLASLSTGQRDALTAVNGDLIYNSSLNKFQGYENGAWVNLI